MYQFYPFRNTGIDFFGELYFTNSWTSEKGWGFIFTCVTTGAVHVEVFPIMGNSSCVIDVERFFYHRGRTDMMGSDNGTNFFGVEKELRDSIGKGNTLKSATKFSHKGIELRFNPPSAPHQFLSGISWSLWYTCVQS